MGPEVQFRHLTSQLSDKAASLFLILVNILPWHLLVPFPRPAAPSACSDALPNPASDAWDARQTGAVTGRGRA